MHEARPTNDSPRHADHTDLILLADAEAAVLRRLWRERKGCEPPVTMTARLMRLALAWDVQASEQGGAHLAVSRAWQASMKRRAEGASPSEALCGSGRGEAQPGTRLIRHWGGATHEVLVHDKDVEWQGRRYRSLSAVARAMTGTPRNGPRFFGLRQAMGQ